MVMDSSMCDPRVLTQLKEEVLVVKWEYLCKNLESERYFLYLRSKRIFTESDEQEILSKITSVARNGLFLDKLKKRMGAYDILVDALKKERVQSFLIDVLEETLQELIKLKSDDFSGKVNMDEAIDEDLTDLPIPGQSGAPNLP